MQPGEVHEHALSHDQATGGQKDVFQPSPQIKFSKSSQTPKLK